MGGSEIRSDRLFSDVDWEARVPLKHVECFFRGIDNLLHSPASSA